MSDVDHELRARSMINTRSPNLQQGPPAASNLDTPVAAVSESSARPSMDEGTLGSKPDGTCVDTTPVAEPTEAETDASLPEATHVSVPAYEPDVQYAPGGWFQSADDYPSGPFYPAPRASDPDRPAGD